MVEIVMNASSSGLMNLSSQLPTVGTISGIGLLLLVLAIACAAYMAHEYNNPKSWLARLLKWINDVGGFKATIGGWTVGFLYGGYLISDWLGSSGGQGTIFGILWYALLVVLGFAALVAIGYVSEPVWGYIYNYVMNQNKNKR